MLLEITPPREMLRAIGSVTYGGQIYQDETSVKTLLKSASCFFSLSKAPFMCVGLAPASIKLLE